MYVTPFLTVAPACKLNIAVLWVVLFDLEHLMRCAHQLRRCAGFPLTLALISAFASMSASGVWAEDAARFWAQWRGPLGTGEAVHGDPPVDWSETKNIRWKAPLFGLGHSTPVVWADKIFLTTAEPHGEKVKPLPERAPGAHDNSPVTQRHRFWVLALDRATGKLLWKTQVHESLPRDGGHYSGSLASNSPVCDAEHVIASFGSQGIYCLTHDGKVVWKKQLGDMLTKHGHGEGSSPVLHKGTLVVNWDHEGQSFVVALNKSNGEELWRKPRREVTSWSSPILVTSEERPQVVIAGTHRVRGYDIKTGQMIWECGGLSNNVVATPVAADGMVFTGSSYDTRAIMGINIRGAKGDITDTDRVIWRRTQRPPYVPSLLLYDNTLYYLRHYQGILTRLDAKTGEEPTGPFRLDRMFEIYASPVAAANRIYITDRDGMTIVIQHGKIPRFLARNELKDQFSASAVVVDNALLLRGEKWLYCIAKDDGNAKEDGASARP